MPIPRLSGNGLGWRVFDLEHQILEMFNNDNAMPISCTWLAPDLIEIGKKWASTENNKTIFLFMSDPHKREWIETHKNFIYITPDKFLFWLLAVDKYFLMPSIDEVKLNKIDNNFLCYQRKVFPNRQLLFDLLKDEKGIITLSNNDFSDINSNLRPDAILDEILPDENIPKHLMMPEDIWSLGNMDVWNSSFLIISTETTHDFDTIFMSEKSFKPIIGMRPFIQYAPPNWTSLLKDRGFELFNDDFGYTQGDSYEDQAHEIKNVVQNLKNENLESLYKKLYPKILHNRENFRSIAKNEWARLEEIRREIWEQPHTT
jgi:hypothetical protein